MTEEQRLQYYYNQLQTIEEALIIAKSQWDIGRIFQMEAEKIKVQDAISWLQSQWIIPSAS